MTGSLVPAKVSFVEKIGPYRILRTIAMGGMGEVYLAALKREGGFEKQVALKCVLPRLMADPRFLELFEREARLAAVLTHRNIVPVFDFGRDQGRAWLAMEFVHGVDVKAVYDHLEGPLPIGLALDIAMACARALDYAHRARDARGRPLNIIHRDVSPQNILLSFEGDVKLADFGLAQATARESQEEGTLKGKFAYMSPEQAEGRAVDGRSDQFSLAVVLYELLSGCRAFYTEDGAEVILARVGKGETLAPLSEVAQFVPVDVIRVVERALSRDRRDRFADAGRFADALAEAARQSGITIGQPEVGPWLQALFPDRAISRRTAEKTIESTAVAADPINLVRAVEEGTQVADAPARPAPSPEIGFENTASAELIRPEWTTSSPGEHSDTPVRSDTPTAETEPNETDRGPVQPVSRVSWSLLALAGLLVIMVTLFMYESSDDPQSVTKDAGPITALSNTPQPEVPKPEIDASRPAALIDARVALVAPDASAPTDTSPPSIDQGRSRGTVRAERRRARRLRRAERRSRKAARLTGGQPSTDQPPATRLDATVAAAPPPPIPDAAMVKAAPPSPEPVLGPRLRTLGGLARIRGPKLSGGWYRLSTQPMNGLIKNETGPNVKFRAFLRNGSPWVAFMSKPYGTLFLDGVDSGPTPRSPRALKSGQTRVKVRDGSGNETEFILHLAN